MAQSNNLLFVFLLLCSTLCLSVCAGSTEENVALEADVFKPNTMITEVQTLTKGSKINITPEKIKPPALFAAAKDGVIVVIAETKYKKNEASDSGAGGENKVDVVSRTFETTGEKKWPTEVFKEVNKKNWKTQLATGNDKKEQAFSKIIASTVNTDGSKIYVFLLNNTEQGSDKKWDFKLVEGTVESEATGGKKTIKWGEKSLTVSKTYEDSEIKKIINGNEPKLTLTDGSVFLTEKEEQFGFVFKGAFTSAGNSVVKSVIIFFNLKNKKEQEETSWYF